MGEKKVAIPRDSIPKKDSLPAHVYRVAFINSAGRKIEYRFYVRNRVCEEECGHKKNVSIKSASFVSALRNAMNSGELNFEFGSEDNFGRIFEHAPDMKDKTGDSVEVGRIHSLSCKDVLDEILKAVNIEVMYEGKKDVLREKLDSPDVIRKGKRVMV